MNIVTEKKCKECGKVKSKVDFPTAKNMPDGHRSECKVCKGKKDKDYRQAHKEQYKGYRAKWKQNNLEKAKECALDWWRRNKERSKRNLQNWRRSNPEKYLVQSETRRMREVSAEGLFTAQQWRDLCEKYHNKCLRCGKRTKLTIDHVVPLSKGGTNYIDNIQPLCGPCNSSKLTKIIDYR